MGESGAKARDIEEIDTVITTCVIYNPIHWVMTLYKADMLSSLSERFLYILWAEFTTVSLM